MSSSSPAKEPFIAPAGAMQFHIMHRKSGCQLKGDTFPVWVKAFARSAIFKERPHPCECTEFWEVYLESIPETVRDARVRLVQKGKLGGGALLVCRCNGRLIE